MCVALNAELTELEKAASALRNFSGGLRTYRDIKRFLGEGLMIKIVFKSLPNKPTMYHNAKWFRSL
jgi:hypothetical protein